jgi:hypothetical protein
MKSIYPNQSVVYLGQLEWNEAIDKALSLGMLVPAAFQMFELLKSPELKELYNANNTLTSTTVMLNCRNFLHPVEKGKLPKAQLENNTNLQDDKKVKRHAFAVSEKFDHYLPYRIFKHPTA